jgi:hypothetical protein
LLSFPFFPPSLPPFLVLAIKPRALFMLDKLPATELHTRPHHIILKLKGSFHLIFKFDRCTKLDPQLIQEPACSLLRQHYCSFQ